MILRCNLRRRGRPLYNMGLSVKLQIFIKQIVGLLEWGYCAQMNDSTLLSMLSTERTFPAFKVSHTLSGNQQYRCIAIPCSAANPAMFPPDTGIQITQRSPFPLISSLMKVTQRLPIPPFHEISRGRDNLQGSTLLLGSSTEHSELQQQHCTYSYHFTCDIE